jgi:hypothetical protein
VAIISGFRHTVNIQTVSTLSCTPYLSLEIIFTFERPIRAEVVTYRSYGAFGSLHNQQLHGFYELRNAKGSFRIAVPRSTQQLHHFICPNHLSVFEFFD